MTLGLLWQEYRRQYPDRYQYSRFCARYRRWAQHLDVVLRQPYRAGEKMFVDWAGLTLAIIDRATGQLHDVFIFVAALGMSTMTYLEGALAQTLPQWIGAHTGAFEYFDGTTAILVLESQTTGSDSRYPRTVWWMPRRQRRTHKEIAAGRPKGNRPKKSVR